jgi:hypothetical protein
MQPNSINGHEWFPLRREDLQYACIFPLPPGAQRDCALYARDDPRNCDCRLVERDPEGTQNPLCQQLGATGPFGEVQYAGKAYPGLRELQVLKDYGANSIVASICARNVDNRDAQDYGYRPAIAAIVDRLKEALSGRCLPRQLDVDENGDVPCKVIEAIAQPGVGCGRPGRADAAPAIFDAAFDRLQQNGTCGGETGRACNTGTFTLCEILPSKAAGGGDPSVADCLEDLPSFSEPGYCYVDPQRGMDLGIFLGEESLVDKCQATEKRLLRFVGDDTPAGNSTVLIACLGAEIE